MPSIRLPSNIAWSLRFLATHPTHRRQIVEDPSLIDHATEEFLRYFSVANPLRKAKRDMVIVTAVGLFRSGDEGAELLDVEVL